MSSSWLEFLGTCGARTAHSVVTDFGDAAAELAAARTATIVSPLRHLGVLEVSGADAMSFLHQQLTSDVKHLALFSYASLFRWVDVNSIVRLLAVGVVTGGAAPLGGGGVGEGLEPAGDGGGDDAGGGQREPVAAGQGRRGHGGPPWETS